MESARLPPNQAAGARVTGLAQRREADPGMSFVITCGRAYAFFVVFVFYESVCRLRVQCANTLLNQPNVFFTLQV